MKAETTTIQLPRTVLETGADKDIEFEGTLADYLPGINRVIRTEANIITEEAVISGNIAEVKGKAIFTLLYESDYKGKLRNEKFTSDFTQRFDIGELPEGEYYPSASCRCIYVSCKPLNPRRFVLKCRGDIRLEIKLQQATEVVSIEDCKGAFFKKEGRSFYRYHPPVRKDFNVEESFSLEEQTPVSDIIYASLQFLPPEINVSEGNINLQSKGVFKCLYEEEDGNTKLYEHSFPVNFNIDDDCITAGCECNGEINCSRCEVIKEQDNYGEYRIFSMHGTAAVCLNIFGKSSISVPTDMFYEDYNCTAKTEQLRYDNIEPLGKHRFNIEKLLEVPDLPFTHCVDTNGEMYITETVAEESGIRVKGNCVLNVLGNNGESFGTHDFSIGFEEAMSYGTGDKNIKIKAYVKLINASGEIIDSGKIRLKATGEIEGICCKKEAFSAITEAEVSKRESDGEECTPIIIYYPGADETAWDIGKRYSINPQLILSNNIEAFDKEGKVAKEHTVLFM